MNDVFTAAEYASRQSDRWAFFVALVVIGLIVWFAAKDSIRQRDNLLKDYKEDRSRYEDTLHTICKDQNDVSRGVAVALDSNTIVLRECRDELKHCRESRT